LPWIATTKRLAASAIGADRFAGQVSRIMEIRRMHTAPVSASQQTSRLSVTMLLEPAT
jgi:hypothetical protein